jgi:hypothetical protein
VGRRRQGARRAAVLTPEGEVRPERVAAAAVAFLALLALFVVPRRVRRRRPPRVTGLRG